MATVRPFRRSDRDQLAQLVNAHAQAVVPGMAISVNAVLSQLEREPGEFIVEPWVVDRVTLVAEDRGRITAAAHLVRYGADERVGAALRDVGEVRWLRHWPEAPFWPDSAVSGRAVGEAALATLYRWGVRSVHADGALPAPGIYGVPEQWPHVRTLLERLGFVCGGRREIVYLAEVSDLPVPAYAVERTLGVCGTRFTARSDGELLGFVEVDTAVAGLGRVAGTWADIGNLEVTEGHRRRGVARGLLGHAGHWLHLARTDRLLAYASPNETALQALLESSGFARLTETAREWTLAR